MCSLQIDHDISLSLSLQINITYTRSYLKNTNTSFFNFPTPVTIRRKGVTSFWHRHHGFILDLHHGSSACGVYEEYVKCLCGFFATFFLYIRYRICHIHSQAYGTNTLCGHIKSNLIYDPLVNNRDHVWVSRQPISILCTLPTSTFTTILAWSARRVIKQLLRRRRISTWML